VKRFIATTAFALTLVSPAFSADGEMKEFSTVAKAERGDLYASELIGMRVYATDDDVEENAKAAGAETDWDDIGEVDDIILTNKGSVKAVILGVGGFLGIGERDIAINMNSLRIVRESNDADDFFLVVNADKDKLMNAPAHDRRPAHDPNAMEKAPAMEAKDAEAGNQSSKHATNDDRSMANTSKTGQNNDESSADTSKATVDKDSMHDASEMARPSATRDGYKDTMNKDITADMLKGAKVYGPNSEEVGEVNELLVTDDGDLDRVVIDIGGFLGVGERPVAFDIDEIQILRKDGGDDVVVIVDATKSALKARPEYRS
jgi:sporulation protein YlmC with PRC-barrel domain